MWFMVYLGPSAISKFNMLFPRPWPAHGVFPVYSYNLLTVMWKLH